MLSAISSAGRGRSVFMFDLPTILKSSSTTPTFMFVPPRSIPAPRGAVLPLWRGKDPTGCHPAHQIFVPSLTLFHNNANRMDSILLVLYHKVFRLDSRSGVVFCLSAAMLFNGGCFCSSYHKLMDCAIYKRKCYCLRLFSSEEPANVSRGRAPVDTRRESLSQNSSGVGTLLSGKS